MKGTPPEMAKAMGCPCKMHFGSLCRPFSFDRLPFHPKLVLVKNLALNGVHINLPSFRLVCRVFQPDFWQPSGGFFAWS